MNGTLDGRGAVKNYYIQVPFQAPRHFSFHTGIEGRSGSIGKHLIVLQCDTIYIFVVVGPVHRDNTVRWPKEKEESSIPTPVY